MNYRERRCQTLDVANITYTAITPMQKQPQKLLWVFSPVLQTISQEDKDRQSKRQQVQFQPSSPPLLKENDMNHTNQLTNKAKQHAIINMGNRSTKGDCNSRNNKIRTYTEASYKSVKNKTIDNEDQGRKSPVIQQIGGQTTGNTRQGFNSVNQKHRVLQSTCPVEQLLNGSKIANHMNNQRQFATLQPSGSQAKGSGILGSSVSQVTKAGGSNGNGITASRNTNSSTSTATRLSKRAMRLSDEIVFSQYDHYLNQSLVIEQQTTKMQQNTCPSQGVVVTEGSQSPFLQSGKLRGRFNFVNASHNNKGLRNSGKMMNNQQIQQQLPIRSESTRSCSKTPSSGGQLNYHKISNKQTNKRDCPSSSSAQALSQPSCARRGGSATAAAVRVYMNHNNSKIVPLRSPVNSAYSCSPHSFVEQKNKQTIISQKQKKINQQQFDQLSIEEQRSLEETRLGNSSKTWKRSAGGGTVASPLLPGNKTNLHTEESSNLNGSGNSSKGTSIRNNSNVNHTAAPQRFGLHLATTPTQQYSNSCKINLAVNTHDNGHSIDKKQQRIQNLPANLPKRPAPLESSFSVNYQRVHSKSINKSNTNTNTNAQAAGTQNILNNQSSKSAQARFSPSVGLFNRFLKNIRRNNNNIPSPSGMIVVNMNQREGLFKQRSLSHNDQYPTCDVDKTPLSYMNSSLVMNKTNNYQQQQQQQQQPQESPQLRVIKKICLPQTTINQEQKVVHQDNNNNNNDNKCPSRCDNINNNPVSNNQVIITNLTNCLQQGQQIQQQHKQQNKFISQYKPIEEYQRTAENKEQQQLLKGSISEENLVDDKTQRCNIDQDESVNKNSHNIITDKSKQNNNPCVEQLIDEVELSMKNNHNLNDLSESNNQIKKDNYIFAHDQSSKQYLNHHNQPNQDSRKSSFYVCCSERARDSAIDFAFSVQNSVKKQGQTITISSNNNNNSNDNSPHPSMNRFQNIPLNARRHIHHQLSSPSLPQSSSSSPSPSSSSSSSSSESCISSSPCQKMHLLRELQQDNIMLMRLQQPSQPTQLPFNNHLPRGSCPDVSPPHPLSCKTNINQITHNCDNNNLINNSIPNKSTQHGKNINNCCRSVLEIHCNNHSRSLIE